MNINFRGNKIKFVVKGVIIGSLILSIPLTNLNENKESVETNIQYVTIFQELNKENEIIELEEKVENREEVEEEKTISKGETKNENKIVKEEKVVTKPKENTSTNTSKEENKTEEKTTVKEKTITLVRSNGSVVQIALEDYIIGVVAAEMPASFNEEALKAQALTARTYALNRIDSGQALSDTTSHQVYNDTTQLKKKWGSDYDKYYNKVKKAVLATKGEYITYGGKYIDAVYHSTSNGKTEDAINVWGNNIPYLKSVDSKWDLNATSYLQTTTKEINNLNKVLGLELNVDTTITVNKNMSNRIETIKIGDTSFDGIKFRTLLGLRSTDFDIAITDKGVVITTRGFGHGVGMSQYGANGMAKEGYNYKQIIKHYYTGVDIKK